MKPLAAVGVIVFVGFKMIVVFIADEKREAWGLYAIGTFAIVGMLMELTK